MPMMDSGVVYEDMGFVVGASMTNNAFQISDGGMYQATLSDFQFPSSFDYLGLLITEGTTTSMGSISGSGSFTFEADPATYHALVVACVSISDCGSPMSMPMSMSMPPSTVPPVGTYGVQVAMVPEADVWVMMIAGLGFMIFMVKRSRARNMPVSSFAAA